MRGCLLLIVCFFSSMVHSAPQVKFTNEQAYEYLKPENDAIYANMVNSVVDNDVEFSLANDKTLGGISLVPHDAKSISQEFDENEITATEKYKGKTTRIKGVVKSISLDAFNNGVITISGGKSFSGDVVASVDKTAGWVKKLVKGNKIDVICKLSGYVMLNVSASCDDSRKIIKNILLNQYGINDKYELPKNRGGLSLLLIMKLDSDKLSKQCEKAGNSCLKSMLNAVEELDKHKQDSLRKVDPRILLWGNTLPK